MMTYDQIFDPPVTFLIRFRKANGIRSIANNSPLVALILLTATCNISSSAQAGGGRFLVSCRIDFVISRFIEKAGTCHMLVFRFRFLFVALSDWQKTSVCSGGGLKKFCTCWFFSAGADGEEGPDGSYQRFTIDETLYFHICSVRPKSYFLFCADDMPCTRECLSYIERALLWGFIPRYCSDLTKPHS